MAFLRRENLIFEDPCISCKINNTTLTQIQTWEDAAATWYLLFKYLTEIFRFNIKIQSFWFYAVMTLLADDKVFSQHQATSELKFILL